MVFSFLDRELRDSPKVLSIQLRQQVSLSPPCTMFCNLKIMVTPLLSQFFSKENFISYNHPLQHQLVNMVNHIDWFAYNKQSLYAWDKAHLIMMYDLF